MKDKLQTFPLLFCCAAPIFNTTPYKLTNRKGPTPTALWD
ncbi:hypothetical protein HMPREF6745_0783 [Prevotella sp. oral taxon 472 str. F0295]|nr:hypothetical protein HMPREF6745_0783 [Prevotella sp. oral taxon 472 str. F0295]